MDSLKYTVKESEQNMKLRDYLKRIAMLSSRLVKQAGRQGRIKVNGVVRKLDYVLQSSDSVEFDVVKEESQDIVAEPMDLDIVYEDMDLVVVNKSPGIVVHPTRSYPYGTLANGLLYYFREKGENCIVRLVSRLDMDTSGLIIIAKNQFSHMALARDMQKEGFEKSYLAVVHGHMTENEGTINLPIFRPTEDSVKRVVDEQGQQSVTHFKIVENLEDADLMKLTLETGRTHQIRVHLSHLNHPIFGDSLYGLQNDTELIGRQALHAYKLGFLHPRTREFLSLETEMPEDMKKLVEKLR